MGAVPALANGFVLGARVHGTHLTLRRQRISQANDPWWFRHCHPVRPKEEPVTTKSEIRSRLRRVRREHVAAQPPAIRSLLFNRPPAPLLDLIPADSVIGLYHATTNEAPTASYAKFFFERGHTLALPRFASQQSEMTFSAFSDPFTESDLTEGPFQLMQPAAEAKDLIPHVVFVPLVGFTSDGHRLGQGGGHYDRWLESYRGRTKVGLAWDVQLVETLPLEPHDQKLDAVVTPTRMYGPFA